MTLATDQQTTFKLIWTRLCVADNDFCNRLLFLKKLCRFKFQVYILTLDLTFGVLPENGTLKLSIVLTNSIDQRTVGL